MSTFAVRRLAQRLDAGKPQQTLRLLFTTITAVDAGAATDGAASVYFADGTDSITATHVTGDDDWNPTVGQPIAVLLVNGSPLILGRTAGFPNI